ncbi:hypothetical protein DUNSADRAFT_305 [Dunaliella salina]|uniref:Uncharacterized protein n=1 Tax=Dunaliella salina TaxID=3046 RepID=A0ABZ3KEQ8_DUNSA|nr:hypothetical protein DUNSADRAFT_305 [Dunaliella salina]|eukprot:KAF5827656.1 hypothetical protein DUNSADRAFT_305 [Dunaliella salina]
MKPWLICAPRLLLWQQATAVAAGMLIARAEAASAAHATGGPPSELDKYKAALLMAVRERQRLSEEVQGELATARAANAAAQQDALQKVAGAAADAAAAAQRAAVAEAEMGRLRAELARLQQDGKGCKVGHQRNATKAGYEIVGGAIGFTAGLEVGRLHHELKQQLEGKSLRAAHEDSIAAREAAAALDRQYKQLRRQYDLDKTRLDAEVASLRGELRARDTDLQKLTQEKQKALEGWQAEAAARILAEESEKRALKAAKKQADTLESLTHARSTNAAIKQQAALAAQRNAALKASDPAAAAINVPAASPAKEAKKGAAFVLDDAGGSPNRAGGGAEEGKLYSPRRRPRTPSTPKSAAKALQGVGGELELSRAEHHRALSRGLAADKTHLGEVLRNQRRALLAAQLAENRAVEEALAAAPEQLRILGLAFRALLVAEPAQLTPDAPGAQLAMGLGAAGYRTFVDPLMVTPHQPPIPPMPGMEVPPSDPMVGISGAVVLLASPGLLSTHPSPPPHVSATVDNSSNQHPGPAANGGSAQPPNRAGDASEGGGAAAVPGPCPLPVAAVMEAAVRGVPLVIVASQGMTLDALLGGSRHAPDAAHARISGTAEATQGPAFSEKALAWINTAWSSRIISDGPQTSSSTLTTQQSASQPQIWESVGRRLGIPDVELKGISLETLKRMSIHKIQCIMDLGLLNFSCIPRVIITLLLQLRAQETLKRMSIHKTLCVPDLRHLNCARVSHLKVLLAPQAPTPSGPEEVSPVQPPIGMQLHTLLDVLRGNTTLTTLTLRGVYLPHLEKLNGSRAANAAALAHAVSSSGVLDLSGCFLGPVAAEALLGVKGPPSGLWGPSLRALNLTGCQIGPQGAAHVAAAIQGQGTSLDGLQTVCLADNRLGPAGAAALCAALTQQQQQQGSCSAPLVGRGSKLKAMDLTLNLLGDEGAKAVSKVLKEASPPLSCLSSLTLGGNAIGVDGARALAQMLPSLPSLLELHLPGNYLGDMGVCALSKAAASLPHLRSLHFQENYNIGTEGARALGNLLSSSASLKVALQGVWNEEQAVYWVCNPGNLLLLSTLHKGALKGEKHQLDSEWCKMRGEGVAHMASALGGHKSLISLNLARNGMGDRGVKALVEALEGNNVLRRLDLRVNSIGLVGCRLVGSLLRDKNTTLMQVFMGGNEMEEHVLEALEDLAATPRTLPQRKRLAVPSAPPPGQPTPSTQPASMASPFQPVPALQFDEIAALAGTGSGAAGGGLGLMSSRRSSARSSGSAVGGSAGAGLMGADGRKEVVGGGESAHSSRPGSAAAAGAAVQARVSLDGRHLLQPRPPSGATSGSRPSDKHPHLPARPLSGASSGSRRALHDGRPVSGVSSSSRGALHDGLQQPSLPMEPPPPHEDPVEHHSLGQRQQAQTSSQQQGPQAHLGGREKGTGVGADSESEDLEALLARYRS